MILDESFVNFAFIQFSIDDSYTDSRKRISIENKGSFGGDYKNVLNNDTFVTPTNLGRRNIFLEVTQTITINCSSEKENGIFESSHLFVI